MFTLFRVLAKLGWTLTHGSSVHENRGGIIKHDYATSTLPENINDFLFSKFAQENFQVSFLSIFLLIYLYFGPSINVMLQMLIDLVFFFPSDDMVSFFH